MGADRRVTNVETVSVQSVRRAPRKVLTRDGTEKAVLAVALHKAAGRLRYTLNMQCSIWRVLCQEARSRSAERSRRYHQAVRNRPYGSRCRQHPSAQRCPASIACSPPSLTRPECVSLRRPAPPAAPCPGVETGWLRGRTTMRANGQPSYIRSGTTPIHGTRLAVILTGPPITLCLSVTHGLLRYSARPAEAGVRPRVPRSRA